MIAEATGIAVGRNNDRTPLGERLEQAMHQAILMGRSNGEDDDQIKARINAARDAALDGGAN
jgi:hypothetical protein